MTTAEMILQKKTVYKAEMDKIMPVEQSDALWQKAAGKLDSIMEQYGLLPKGVKMHTDKILSLSHHRERRCTRMCRY